MKIVFLGTPQFAVVTLEKIVTQPDLKVVGVVTQPDRKRGRGNQLWPSPVKAVATEHQLAVQQPVSIKKSIETIDWLRSLQADVFVVVAYGQILSQEILDIPKWGCINVHGSLLPAYRGAAPIQRCLVDGVTETGITTMLMDAGMDTGAMLLTVSVAVSPLTNAQELGETLAKSGAELLIQTLQQLPFLTPQPQDDSQATYAAMIRKTDWLLDWSRSAIELHNQIRGFYPDCYFLLRDQPVKILQAVPLALPYWTGDISADLPVGQVGSIAWIIKSQGPVIQTGEGYLLLQQVQLSGKKPQSGADFVNGCRLLVGLILSAV
jgi:methionyl-tRNA formyltransferase